MDERAALALLSAELEDAGDDAAVVDDLVITTDMLHERTDFPPGTTRYTAGWRAVGASLSDVAAMGAEATAAVAAYAAPAFDDGELLAFVRGARDVCERVGASYVGGDLDEHQEFTVASTAIGRTDDLVFRSGARPGDAVCVTGTLGRSAAALELFNRAGDGPARDDEDDLERANALFQFEPRVAAGRTLAGYATAMMDSSDGLARSLHQLAEASDCGFTIDADRVPITDALTDVADDDAVLDLATTFGEDFELVVTLSESDLEAARSVTDVRLSRIGSVVTREDGITLDGEPLADRGYTHG
ncbi:thiamine-phosphate kinase [Natrarchaeobaculum sulfurireducens]|uniref:Thiamine-monophosphate kinase n=1 Tax=Natrarchaeobaculum sulfurireducens TaxID=2044521 RepID=A0A346PB46_9EURY|nr:thiamine-phosphate kinase [Natrarchaeobaculum sulfurireducens]AXR76741.1 Thiamine monophosphate kinase [Natrarchaeobaculum sulfurireducens]AXR80412.1 Thiamine-monophosphate kinase [Natrarchaeobaculum sulfurireducens]